MTTLFTIFGTILTAIGYVLLIVAPFVVLGWIVAAIANALRGKKGNGNYPYPLNKYLN
jgi:hypothetical protein